MLSILVDSITKDYVLANGNIGNSLASETMMYIRLLTPRKAWLYSQNDPTFGSDLFRFTSTRIAVTPLMVEKTIFDALRPMVELKQIKNLQVIYKGISTTGAWLYNIAAEDISGAPIQFPYPYYKVN